MTYADIKKAVANHLGKTDDTTAVALRDNAINDALRQIYQESKWSWLLATANGTLSSYTLTLPANYNPQFGLEYAYTSEAGTGDDHIYLRASLRDWDSYALDGADYVYNIAYNTTTNRYIFTSKRASDTVYYYYTFIPADLSSGTDVVVCPDPSAVVYLAVSKYWQGSERDDDNAKLFYDRYMQRLDQMKKNDKASNTTRTALRTLIDQEDNTAILATRR